MLTAAELQSKRDSKFDTIIEKLDKEVEKILLSGEKWAHVFFTTVVDDEVKKSDRSDRTIYVHGDRPTAGYVSNSYKERGFKVSEGYQSIFISI